YIYFLLIFFRALSLDAKIYDCFLFFNELELLEGRLNELYDHVDKFVLVESTETFRGNSKLLYYEDTRERFRKFADKIIHIQVKERIDTQNPWEREFYQRGQIMRGLSECLADDIVLISDADEFVSHSSLAAIKAALQVEKKEVVGCSQTLYRF